MSYDDKNDLGELALFKAYSKHHDADPELPPYVDPADDPEVRARNELLDAEIDKATARRIDTNAPGHELLVKARNKHVAALRKLHNIAVGETPEDFIEPDKTEPSYSKPKAATGFEVVSKRRKRPAAAPAPSAPDPAPAAPVKPAPWLWNR